MLHHQIFLASLIAVVFYSVVYLIIRGTLSFRNGVKFTLDPEARWNSQGPSDYRKFVGSIARSMLLFPFVYVLLMLPHIIACLLETSGLGVSFALKTFAVASSSLLGVGHVLVFYNTLRVMSHALNGSSRPERKADVESFVSPDKSPVDVAPPVAQIMSQKAPAAFPVSPISPRNGGHPIPTRQQSKASLATSVTTVGNGSTIRLLAPVPQGHSRTASSITASSTQRSITPASELNEILSAASSSAYPYTGRSQTESDSDADSLVSLPAPRRPIRSPMGRQPSIVVNEPELERPLTVVSLASPASARPTRPGRDSFINMYATHHDGRSPRLAFGTDERVASPPVSARSPQFRNRTLRPSASARTLGQRQAAAQSFASSFASFRDGPVVSPQSSSSNFSSSPSFSPGSSGNLPNSPFMDAFIQRASMALDEPHSPRSEGHYRTASDVPMSAVVPSLAYAAIRNNAARGEMSRAESARLKSTRRRSKSLDNIRGGPASTRPRASMTRPERPVSPGLRSAALLSALSRQETSPATIISPRGSIKLSERATLHEGPSKTTTVSSNPGTPKPFGYI